MIKRKLLVVAVSTALGFSANQQAHAANDIEIVSGTEFTNLTGTDALTTTNDSAVLGIDYFSSALDTNGATLDISTTESGLNTQDGDINFNSNLDLSIYEATELTLNAHDDIIFNGDVSTTTLTWTILNLNPDSDASGTGQVVINGGFDVWSFGSLSGYNSSPNDININGNVLVNGTVSRMGFSSVISGDLNISSTGTFDSRNDLTVQDINVESGGSFNYIGGDLHLTNGDVTVAEGGLLGAVFDLAVTSSSIRVENLSVGTVDVASGVVNQSQSMITVDNTLTVNQGGSYNLTDGALATGNIVNEGQILVDRSSNYGGIESTGNIVNNGQLTLVAGEIQAADIVNNGQFDFTGGRLHLTNAGITMADGGLIGKDVTLISGGREGVHVVSQTVGTADVDSGSVAVEEGGRNTVDTSLTINAGGSYSLAGGWLTAGEIINNGGSFSFTDGYLNLTNSGIDVVSGGLLGADLVIETVRPANPDGTPVLDALGNSETISRRISATTLSVGTADADSGSVSQTSNSMTIAGDVTINAGGSYHLDGGRLTTGSITNNGGSFVFTGGHLDVTSSNLTIGQNGPLDTTDVVLSSSSDSISIENDHVLTIEAGSSLTINSGARVSAGSINTQGDLIFNAGGLNLTNSDLLIGSGGSLGQTVELTSGKNITFTDERGFVNGHGIVLAADGTLILNGGVLAADSVTTNGGTFDFQSGILNAGGATRIGVGSFLGTELALNANSIMHVSNDSVLTIDAGSTLIMDGGLLTLSEGLVTNGSFVFNSGELRIRRVGTYPETLDIPELVIGSSAGAMNDLNLGAGADLGVDGEILIEAGSSLVIDGGIVSADRIDNEGNLSLTSGVLDLTELSIGTTDVGTIDERTGALGTDVVLGADTTLRVQSFNTQADSSLTLDGGTLDVSGWSIQDGSFTFNSGHLRLGMTLRIGGEYASSALGNSLSLSANRTVDVNVLDIGSDGRVESTGGSQEFNKVDNDGRFYVRNGQATVSQAYTNSPYYGFTNNGAVVVSDAGTLAVNEIVRTIDGVEIPTIEYTQTSGSTRVDGRLIANDIHIDGGTLRGSGVVDGNVTVNGGQINPGNSPGTLEITGDLVLTEAGTLHMEVGSDGLGGYLNDQLIVGGDYDLQGGLLKFSLLDGIGISEFESEFTIGDFFRHGTEGSDTAFDLLLLSMFDNIDLYAYDILGNSWYSLALGTDGSFLATVAPAPVPVPAAIWLFGSGLLGLASVARRKARAA